MDIVYLNGKFLPKEQAKVSVMDRGFLFGDGIYEVIPVYNGKMLGASEHLMRLHESLEEIHMQSPLSNNEWFAIFKDLLLHNEIKKQNANIYLQITRGSEHTRNHAIPDQASPTVLAFCTAAKAVEADVAAKGFSAITAEDTRKKHCNIKSINLLPNILLYHKAREAGALEAILIRDGEVLECTSSNLFIVKAKKIITPPLTHKILGGITRELILHLAKTHGMAYEERAISKEELTNADEIWVTGSSKEICPIITLNDNPVGNGIVGPLWHQIKDHYEAYKKEHNND